MTRLWPRTKGSEFEPLAAKATRQRISIEHGLPEKLLSIVILLAVSGMQAWSSAGVLPENPDRRSLSQTERCLRRLPSHISEFSSTSEPMAIPKCGKISPPEALMTPDPPLPVDNDDLLVRVSFIVGSDGHVHSAFVLKSGGVQEDQLVLRAVREWRYRPALCNGVPTDSEARVRFTIP